jgi:hypothetical protein
MADTGSHSGDVGDRGSSHEDEMVGVEETGEARSLSPAEAAESVNTESGQVVSDDESLGLSVQEVSLHDPSGTAEDMEGVLVNTGEDEVAASGSAVAKESKEVDITARRSPPHSLTSEAGSASEKEGEDVLTEVHSESSEVSTKEAPVTGRRARE